jgi:large subunit ribosomal protein LP0
MPANQRKLDYAEKLIGYVEKYQKILLVNADHVGSNHMQSIRRNLRGKAELLMGKNTMIRKALKGHLSKNEAIENLLPHVVGNVGFIFTNADLGEIRTLINTNRVSAPARVGSIANCNVTVPAGPTGLDPQQTSFMQALNIPTKINKGQVEIISDVLLLKPGDKVGSSEATLLAKLNIKPFSYGLALQTVYDNGFVYDPALLDITDDDLLKIFVSGVQNIAALSVAAKQPSVAAIPHHFASAYRNVLAVSIATEYTFDGSKKIKELLADPEAFAKAAAAAAQASAPAASSGAPSKAAEAAPAKVEEPAEEEEEEMGFGLFGDD